MHLVATEGTLIFVRIRFVCESEALISIAMREEFNHSLKIRQVMSIRAIKHGLSWSVEVGR